MCSLREPSARHRNDVGARYTRTAVWLHWLVALVILVQVPFGWYLDEIPRGTPARGWYVNLHKSIGLTVGIAILLRVWWRWRHRPPALPERMGAWERIGANTIHLALYACMLIMPLTGYVASNFSQWGVKYFNAIELPPWGVDDHQVYAFFNGAHVATSYLFVTLILLHAASAVWHACMRDGILGRMSLTRRG